MKKRYLWHIVLVCYILFIYSNSMTPAVVSSRESGTVLNWLHQILDSMGLSALWLTEHIIRKCAHFGEYAILGVLLTKTLEKTDFDRQSRLFFQLFLTVFLPFVDETIQIFTPGRSAQVSDVWLDISGVIVGSFLCCIFHKAVAKMGKRRKIRCIEI